MEKRIEQRGTSPLPLEDIGLGYWHVRWNITEKTNPEANEVYFEYNEVTLDHKPTATEIKSIIA